MSLSRLWLKEIPQVHGNGALKCTHCGEDIGSFLSRIIYQEDGTEERIHSDPIMKKDCLTAAGMNDTINRINEHLLMLMKTEYMKR